MRNTKIKQFTLLFYMMLSAAWCYGTNLTDGYSHIQIMQTHVQGAPKSSSIQASINDHCLMVTFTENLK